MYNYNSKKFSANLENSPEADKVRDCYFVVLAFVSKVKYFLESCANLVCPAVCRTS